MASQPQSHPVTYRPWALRAWRTITRYPVMTSPVLIAALVLRRFVPVAAIETLFFEERNPETARIAHNFKG